MAREREHSSTDRPISGQTSYAPEQAPHSSLRPEPAPKPVASSTNGKESATDYASNAEQSAVLHSTPLQQDSIGEIEAFLDLALRELSALRTRSEEDSLNLAADLILERENQGGRVHVTGVGKSEYVARYIASLLSSTGTPGYFLHATECVHGSAGQLCRSDVAIAISNSGSTPELMSAVEVLKELDIKIIGVSGNRNSALAAASDVFLYAGVDNEGGALNLAPRASILAENLVLCALSVALEARKGLTREQYARWHPGGVIGKLARGD
jgi:arabinose-5-phosphate isomerase